MGPPPGSGGGVVVGRVIVQLAASLSAAFFVSSAFWFPFCSGFVGFSCSVSFCSFGFAFLSLHLYIHNCLLHGTFVENIAYLSCFLELYYIPMIICYLNFCREHRRPLSFWTCYIFMIVCYIELSWRTLPILLPIHVEKS